MPTHIHMHTYKDIHIQCKQKWLANNYRFHVINVHRSDRPKLTIPNDLALSFNHQPANFIDQIIQSQPTAKSILFQHTTLRFSKVYTWIG